MAPHSSTLVWKIPWTEEPGRMQSMGSLRVGHDWATSLSLSRIREGNGNPLQCSCLENPRDGGAWWAAIYGVAQGRTRLKWLSSSSSRAMGKANVKPYSKSQGMNFIEQICKQAQPKQVHQPTFSHHPSHSLQGEGGACGHKVSAAGGTPRAALLLVYLLCLKSCIFFLILFYF